MKKAIFLLILIIQIFFSLEVNAGIQNNLYYNLTFQLIPSVNSTLNNGTINTSAFVQLANTGDVSNPIRFITYPNASSNMPNYSVLRQNSIMQFPNNSMLATYKNRTVCWWDNATTSEGGGGCETTCFPYAQKKGSIWKAGDTGVDYDSNFGGRIEWNFGCDGTNNLLQINFNHTGAPKLVCQVVTYNSSTSTTAYLQGYVNGTEMARGSCTESRLSTENINFFGIEGNDPDYAVPIYPYTGMIYGAIHVNYSVNQEQLRWYWNFTKPEAWHYLQAESIIESPAPTNISPIVEINTPLNNSQRHNTTKFINFTITNADNDNVTYYMFLDTNSNPITIINQSNITQGNFTFLFTITTETAGSINNTYYIKINGTDNASNTFTLTNNFNLTNDINQFNTTNVTITPLPLSANTQARCHFNLTNIETTGFYQNQSDNISLRDVKWYINKSVVPTANNNTLLNAPNVTTNSNISCEVRINNGFGATAWTRYINSSTLNIGDTALPTITNLSLQYSSLSSGTNIFTFPCEDLNSNLNKMNFTFRFNGTTINHTRILIFTDGFCAESTSTKCVTPSQNYSWNYNMFQTDETLLVGGWNITEVGCSDTSNNNVYNLTTTTLEFNVTSAPPPPSGSSSPSAGGGGGGAGCPPNFTKNETSGECINISSLVRVIGIRNLSLTPSSNIDTLFFFTTFNQKNAEWRYLLKANKVLKNCTTTGNFKCQIFQNSDVLLTSLQKKPNFFSKVEQGSIKVIDVDNQVSFRVLTIRMINISYTLPILPFKGSFIITLVISGIVTFIYRKNLRMFIKIIYFKVVKSG